MPVSCAARGCKNRYDVSTRSRGVTFHRFPKDAELRKRWERAAKRRGFRATRWCRICSDHFKPEDFDSTGQTVRLRDGSVPSVFTSRAHLQKPVAARTAMTSPKDQERISLDSSGPEQKTQPLPGPSADHTYALPPSPSEITARLSQALARVESLEREKRKAEDREQRAKDTVRDLLEHLKGKHLVNEQLKDRLTYLMTAL